VCLQQLIVECSKSKWGSLELWGRQSLRSGAQWLGQCNMHILLAGTLIGVLGCFSSSNHHQLRRMCPKPYHQLRRMCPKPYHQLRGPPPLSRSVNPLAEQELSAMNVGCWIEQPTFQTVRKQSVWSEMFCTHTCIYMRHRFRRCAVLATVRGCPALVWQTQV